MKGRLGMIRRLIRERITANRYAVALIAVALCFVGELSLHGCSPDTSAYDSLSADGRCEAITLKGTRCKRRAQSQSHYCWQHQELEATYPNQ